MSTPRLLLGFDYGTKQIGVAVGQMITGQARELCVLKARDGIPDWSQIEALLHDERLTTYEAKGERLRAGQSDGFRQRPVDALAAALLLEGWLTAQPKA